MTRLSVNINKIATLRNARGGNVPNVIQVAKDLELFGAQGITVHPRPDERHIRRADVYDLKQIVTTEFNIEGYPSDDFIRMVCDVKPQQVTLVPDPPEALTSSAGWDTKTHFGFLTDVIKEFKQNGIRTSIFIETELNMFDYAARIGTDRIELYTEPYASMFPKDKAAAVAPFARAAAHAHTLGLGINAGHDLSSENLKYFIQNVPNVDEVSIGHALISEALYLGLHNMVQLYLNALRG